MVVCLTVVVLFSCGVMVCLKKQKKAWGKAMGSYIANSKVDVDGAGCC